MTVVHLELLITELNWEVILLFNCPQLFVKTASISYTIMACSTLSLALYLLLNFFWYAQGFVLMSIDANPLIAYIFSPNFSMHLSESSLYNGAFLFIANSVIIYPSVKTFQMKLFLFFHIQRNVVFFLILILYFCISYIFSLLLLLMLL